MSQGNTLLNCHWQWLENFFFPLCIITHWFYQLDLRAICMHNMRWSTQTKLSDIFVKLFSHTVLFRKFWSCLSFSSISWFLIFRSFWFRLFIYLCVYVSCVFFSILICLVLVCSLKRVGDRKRHVFRHFWDDLRGVLRGKARSEYVAWKKSIQQQVNI